MKFVFGFLAKKITGMRNICQVVERANMTLKKKPICDSVAINTLVGNLCIGF